ncbi:transcriptional repressor [Mycobacterium kyorinense]|uniref:Fur family transcriptional regulator n=1 Tax=Mycobacterium kyorinense TaxID=487514 RepID=A0A1X1XL45_9MYCO|nr:transcriptional repressor [Mycobacterium kyorinense]ORV99581.1 Fur family transcriptional regulator [Mycobacterium kyorinense]
MNDRVAPELLRQTLLSYLTRASRSLTTAQLREHTEEHFRQPIVIETIYRSLTVLERRGDVKRHNISGRHAHWVRS